MRTKDFKIVKLLGKGTYGAVYKVIRKSDNEEYALKEVSLKALKKREREDAVNEVRVLASIKHRNILRYCEAFLEGSNLYIVTEYSKGGDLHGKIKRYTAKRKSLAEKTVWTYLLQLCSGLETLHKINIMHRDLKPKNIFLTAHNQIRLGDLGCAKVMKAGMARTQIGTPYYMSPEIWEHKSYNAASDMWALGCIVFEMCSGRPPFLANDMQGLARKVRFNASPTIGSAYSRDLASLVKRLLSKDPRNRPTAHSILQMDKIKAVTKDIPETPANSRWNHKNIENYEGHVRHGVLSTIKVPKQNNRHRHSRMQGHNMNGIKLPEARYPVRKLVKAMDDIAIGVGGDAMSSPLRPTQNPVQVKKNRPSSAGNERPALAPIPVKVNGVKRNVAADKENIVNNMVKPSRPTDNAGRNRNVAPKGGRAHSKYSQNNKPAIKHTYDAQGHRIRAPSTFLEAGGVKKQPTAAYNRQRNYGGYGGYRHVAGPTRLW
jgi:serine/threonine protein kinase